MLCGVLFGSVFYDISPISLISPIDNKEQAFLISSFQQSINHNQSRSNDLERDCCFIINWTN